MRDHETLIRKEFSRQADPMAKATLFNDEGVLARAGLAVESCQEWTNHREFDEWLRITNAPERVGPLKVVMSALARSSAIAGISLRLEGEKILFEHRAALTVAVKG